MIFPFRDHNPSRRTPFITWGLIALNVAIFLSYGFETNENALFAVYTSWGLQPVEIWQGQDLHALLTTMFFHGGWMHLIGNMVFLWIYGDNLEDQMGHTGFLVFYLLGGLAATTAQVVIAPFSPVPLVGASGAIAAVMGGYLLLFPKARIDMLFFIVVYFRIFSLPAWIVLGLWFAMQLASGFAMADAMGGVAYWAHAGGFVAGLLMVWPLWIKKGGTQFWRRSDMHPPHPETRYARSRIPVISRRR